MPEILFITNEQSLLEIIDQLKALVDVRIDIVNDFSQGLKEIFFRQPAVVFIQSEIGGITGEKVASQVRALLEEEPIRLVLLHNKANEWQVADSNFNGNIDISLPAQELIRQLQQQVLYAVQGMSADAGETQQNDSEKGELPIDSPKPVDEYAIDSLADIFPAHLPEDWGASLHDDGKDAQTVAGRVEPVFEPIKPGEEFSFDTIQDNFSDVVAGSAIPPLLPETGLLPEPLLKNSLPGQDPAGDNERPEGDVRSEGQEPPPYLSSSVSGEILSGMDFHQFETFGSAIAEESGGSQEPVLTFVDPPETSGANSSSLAAPAGHPERSTAMADQASQLLSAAQIEVPPLLGASTPPRAGSWPKHFGTDAPDAEFADDIPFREDFGKKSPLTLKVFIGLLILIISLATIFIAREWLGGPEQVTVSVAPPPAPLPAPLRELPAFVPGVTPDSAYAAAHPGWERREADGLEYLIYRENGRIRAIQIIAGTQGVISFPFLKTCLRETTGREDADKWVREKRDDFLVEKGTLRNKGELAVYRKMPEGDIRGFVLTFY